MTQEEFEKLLDVVIIQLRTEALKGAFKDAKQFETRVREAVHKNLDNKKHKINFSPHAQAFPDIAVGKFGIEVKFTTNDTWRSIANSVLETNRIDEVKKVYLIFGKMGGSPDVKWGEYEKCVMHVRTSHVPRFEVEINTSKSLFDQMGVTYDQFRVLEMADKMLCIRQYARSRLKDGERLWWLEDSPNEEHTLPMQARLYTKLSSQEKTTLRAEAVLLCPRIVDSGRSKNKYDDVVLYLLTYHGVLCHQARDLFSAGSVANPTNDDNGGIYIERSLKLIEADIFSASMRMDDALFVEYWGYSVPPKNRIKEWLRQADGYAKGWTPSDSLFLEYQVK
jgi:hypothetical protein